MPRDSGGDPGGVFALTMILLAGIGLFVLARALGQLLQ